MYNDSIKFKTTILIQRRDGTTYDLGAEGIRVISFDPPSANYQHTYSQVNDIGAQLTGTQVQQKTIPLLFDVYAMDRYDYRLQEQKVKQIFSSIEPFYVINSETPYKRWKVVAEPFSYPKLGNSTKAKSVAVNLVCYEGYSESVATTQDEMTFSNGKFGIGMNFGFDQPKYTFKNVSQFDFYNPSVIPLFAGRKPVQIEFVGNAPNGVTISNLTTGQSFTYYKSISKGDNLLIVGVMPIMNGIQRLGNGFSNRAYLDFATGHNLMRITGTTDYTIKFTTRFYYD